MSKAEETVEHENNTNNNPAIDEINSLVALRIKKRRMKKAV
jgi:hypothetical protein